jgi:hypothetical protein
MAGPDTSVQADNRTTEIGRSAILFVSSAIGQQRTPEISNPAAFSRQPPFF